MTPAFAFRTALNARIGGRGLALQYGRGGRGRSRNVLRISTQPKPTILYIKESNSGRPGFWGLTRNHVDRFHDGQYKVNEGPTSERASASIPSTT